jgi:hypothetical protein
MSTVSPPYPLQGVIRDPFVLPEVPENRLQWPHHALEVIPISLRSRRRNRLRGSG